VSGDVVDGGRCIVAHHQSVTDIHGPDNRETR
jgi:hypothetical protein